MNVRAGKNERGIALLMCMLALLLITAIAMGLIFMADTETAINGNYRDEQKAYFAAMAGLQEARVRLMTGVSPTIKPLIMPASGTATGVYYILNAGSGETVAPWLTTNKFFDTELCHEQFTGLSTISSDVAASALNVPCSTSQGSSGWYTSATSTSDPYKGTTGSLDYKWVRVTQKANASATPYLVTAASTGTANYPICWDGTHQLQLPGGAGTCEAYSATSFTTVYRLTSMAMTSLGSRRMVQMEVANNPPIVTKGAVDSQDHVTLNGALEVNGFDSCSCDTAHCASTTTGNGSNAVTTWTCPSLPGKTCDTSKYAIYASGTVDNPNRSETLKAGTDPIVAQNQAWTYDIPAMINSYKSSATDVRSAPYNYSCTVATGTANGDCGNETRQQFGIPPAFPPTPPDHPLPDSSFGACNTSVTPWTGAGCPTPQVTYVPGNLQITAGSTGNGILIVDGDLNIHGGLQFYGLILVRGVVKFTGGGSDRTNIVGAVLAGQESYVDNTLGGSAVINFNACALKNNNVPSPPSMLNIHEVSY